MKNSACKNCRFTGENLWDEGENTENTQLDIDIGTPLVNFRMQHKITLLSECEGPVLCKSHINKAVNGEQGENFNGTFEVRRHKEA